MNIQQDLREVTLKEASILCRKSEKTLRRKIEAGLLEGRKEPLEFGGFMWVIDIDSLEKLYPGSRPSQLPQLYASPEPPQVRLKSQSIDSDPDRPTLSSPSYKHSPISGQSMLDESNREEEDDDDEEEEWNARQSFFDYILDENRQLKVEIKDREARIIALNERAFVLERALGEQEGKANTQARVLEWFQSQEEERDQKRAVQERKLLEQGPQLQPPQNTKPYISIIAGAAIPVVVFLILALTGALAI